MSRVMRNQEQRRRDCSRMVGVFGHREMEIAAILILDRHWQAPFEPIDMRIFEGEPDALEGFKELKECGWIRGDIATGSFWMKIHGR